MNKTKQKLIEVAANIFAEKGFKGTTVRDICRESGQSLGSVNYHFGNKDKLYKKVIENCLIKVILKYPSTYSNEAEVRPEERLRVFIKSFLNRFHDIFCDPEKSWLGKLLLGELLNPSEAFKEVFVKYQISQKDYIQRVVADLTGIPVSDARNFRKAVSVIGQCLHFSLAHNVFEILSPGNAIDNDIEILTEHIFQFSLAGIKGGAK